MIRKTSPIFSAFKPLPCVIGIICAILIAVGVTGGLTVGSELSMVEYSVGAAVGAGFEGGMQPPNNHNKANAAIFTNLAC